MPHGLRLFDLFEGIPRLSTLSTPMECWGLAVAVAERLAEVLGARVCPQYLENALNTATGNHRVTVGLTKDTRL